MESYLSQPWSLTAAGCALVPTVPAAHDIVVGRPAVGGTAVQLRRPESVPSNESPTTLIPAVLADQGISDFLAQATGMTTAPKSGVQVSGVPPRGRPV